MKGKVLKLGKVYRREKVLPGLGEPLAVETGGKQLPQILKHTNRVDWERTYVHQAQEGKKREEE